MNDKTQKIKPENAMTRLEALCVRSEHSVWELQRKLSAWGITQEDTSKIIQSLIKRKFVDDCRFAKAYCHDKFHFSRWGRLKITHGLIQKHISREYITEAISKIDENEYEQTLIDLLKIKSHTIDEPTSYDGKTKLFRFATSRGFEPSTAIKIINNSKLWVSEE